MQIFKALLNILKKSEETPKQENNKNLSPHLQKNIEEIQDLFQGAQDLLFKEFYLGGRPSWKVAVIYLESMVDENIVHQYITEPLMIWSRPAFAEELMDEDVIKEAASKLIPAQDMQEITTLNDIVINLLEGNTVFLIDGSRSALAVEAKGWPSRGVQEPMVEVTLRGPRHSFTETLMDNVALIRRHLKNAGLVNEHMSIGRKSKTDIRVMYLRDIAQPEIVNEVKRRLESIDTDLITDSGVIQNLITDHPYSLFPTIRSTERPDTAASELNEGRVVVLVDNTPFALVMPITFYTIFTSPDDHYGNFHVASTLRGVRFSGFVISTFFTPFYVALSSFHQELIPLPLLLNIAATQQGVPFPIGLSAFLAELVLEILREAGVRLPQQFGPAVSIVGALVLGQAAIQAGFISPGVVIVVTTAAIASFATPRTEAAISFRLLRFPFLFLAMALGFYGIAFGVVIMIYHLASLKSFGIPYYDMYTPGRVSTLGEGIIFLPEQVRRPVRPGGFPDRIKRGAPPDPRDPKEGGNKEEG